MSIKDVTDKDPFAAYDELRSEGGAVWDDGLNGWLLPDFAGCSHAARQEGKVFAPPWGEIPGGIEILGKHGLYLLRGDEHRDFHLALQQWFSQAAADPEMILSIRDLLDEIVNGLETPGRVEFWSQVAEVLPGRIMLRMLGLPVEEPLRLRLLGLNHYLNAWFGSFGTSEKNRHEAIAAVNEVHELVGPTIRARREQPGPDLISELWRIGDSLFSDWGEDDITKYVFFMIGAGTFNTSSVLGASAYVLLTTPGLRESISESPESIPTLVEEVMRLWGPVQLRTRKAMVDTEVAGVQIPKGDIVFPMVGSANRDPAKFDNPDDLDIERAKSRTHLAFYAGSRFCLGAPLARLEAEEVILAIMRLFPNAQFAPGFEAPQFQGLTYRNFKPLELVYDIVE